MSATPGTATPAGTATPGGPGTATPSGTATPGGPGTGGAMSPESATPGAGSPAFSAGGNGAGTGAPGTATPGVRTNSFSSHCWGHPFFGRAYRDRGMGPAHSTPIPLPTLAHFSPSTLALCLMPHSPPTPHAPLSFLLFSFSSSFPSIFKSFALLLPCSPLGAFHPLAVARPRQGGLSQPLAPQS